MILFLSGLALGLAVAVLVYLKRAKVEKLESAVVSEIDTVEHRACDVCGELKSLFRSIEGRGTVCRDCEKK